MTGNRLKLSETDDFRGRRFRRDRTLNSRSRRGTGPKLRNSHGKETRTRERAESYRRRRGRLKPKTIYGRKMEFLAIECQRIRRKLNISAAREQQGKGLGP